MIRGGNRSYHHRSGNRNGYHDDEYYRRQLFRPGFDQEGLGPRGGGNRRYHDLRHDIHHRFGNHNGERDDDHYRRLQFRRGMDHRGLGPHGGNRYHDDWDVQFRPGLDHGGGNSNSQEV